MIVIVPVSYVVTGPIIIKSLLNGADLRSAQRRVTRSSTLDGGNVIYHGGFSHADRDIVIATNELTESQLSILVGYLQDYTTLLIYQIDGAYKVTTQDYNVANDTFRARFLVTEKVS